METMPLDDKVCAWRAHQQGLDGSLAGRNPAEVLERTGWMRSVGGSSPYLALFARAGLRRERVDAALAAAEIHELPAARGCTYVVPARDYALALAVGRPFAGDEMKVARKLGVTDAEIDTLRIAVAAALKAGPQAPDELKTALGGAVRNLGPEGVKKGITTTLPVALGLMQSAGEIRRVPVTGRLDNQRYRYALWEPNPLAGFTLRDDEAFAELARLYFGWFGPVPLKDFQEFAGIGVKAAEKARQAIDLKDTYHEIGLVSQRDGEAFAAYQPPSQPCYSLVSNLDNIHPRVGEGHAISDRGQTIGQWEFDTATMTIAWASSASKDPALQAAVARTEAFIREDLGDARSFSLDSPKSRIPRIEALRKAAAAK